jgi:hypothetical protein
VGDAGHERQVLACRGLGARAVALDDRLRGATCASSVPTRGRLGVRPRTARPRRISAIGSLSLPNSGLPPARSRSEW